MFCKSCFLPRSVFQFHFQFQFPPLAVSVRDGRAQVRAARGRDTVWQGVTEGDNGSDSRDHQGSLLPFLPLYLRNRHHQAPPHARPGRSLGALSSRNTAAAASCSQRA